MNGTADLKSRGLEKVYPKGDLIATLRRLADALRAGKPFFLQVAGQRLRIAPGALIPIEPSTLQLNMRAR